MSDRTNLAPRVAVVSCMRDEGPYIVEWIAHLRAIGVAEVLVFTNDCEDGSEDLLDRLAPAGVTHIRQGQMRAAGGQRPQWAALGLAWDHPVVAQADWLIHMDCDEWFALDGVGSLQDLIARCGTPDAIAIPWRLFGCDGRLAPGEGLTAERFRRAAPEGMVFPALGSFFKTLFRREGPFTGMGVHRPRQSAVPDLVDNAGQPDAAVASHPNRIILWRQAGAASEMLVQLNHYSVRSIHEFLVKTRRGLPNHVTKPVDLAYWVERNFNDTICTKIVPQIAGTNEEKARILEMPGVREADAACRDWHARRLSEILATPEGARLCGHLVLAARSMPPASDLGRVLLAQTQAAMKGPSK